MAALPQRKSSLRRRPVRAGAQGQTVAPLRQATIIDAGVGNLGNLQRALAAVGAESEISRDPGVIARSRCLFLPGVGAFRPPREALRDDGTEAALRQALAEGAWLLGICVGYQLLFAAGEEHGMTPGLDLLAGTVRSLPPTVPLPHIGWNRLEAVAQHPLVDGLEDGDYVYFVHTYAPQDVPAAAVLASATHGRRFPAVAGEGRVFGTQFHPEKSDQAGLRLLANFLEMAHGTTSGN